jgi:protein-disulfide isomerase
VIEEALALLKVKRQEEEKVRIQRVISESEKPMLHDPDSPLSGNVSGDVTVIEFYDYRCGYCKRVASSVTQLQQEDRGVRVVYKDYPISGETSVLASRAALSEQVQDKHQVFHEALVASKEDLTKEVIWSITDRVGLDRKQLETDMMLPQWDAILERNRALADVLAISGTPGFIVGGELQPGAFGLDELKKFVAKARGK